ncbi:universal stress protein [Sediminicola sp. YIK13]|uniref:universal stress protein n=1 Tax=Sediminicola sp. YIK13 TaxID=1453352 RepID=UPI0007211018|nr:universal stress protein [Sediminicola sp. YIK13]ALM09140.1 universal stress protein [Sediminicola sp. YIK13]
MKKILIPTDFSENAWNALTFGLALFAKEKCHFLLLHINPIVYTGAENAIIMPHHLLKETVIEKSREKLKSWTQKIEKASANKNHIFESLAVYDFFVDAIKLQLEKSEVDLIVMGTKGATGLKKVTIGSNTGHVITKIKCPLLAVPENAKFNGLKEIMFPTDYHTGIDINVLEDLKAIMALHNSSLKIVHMVSREDEKLTKEQDRNKDFLKDYFSNSDQSFQKIIDTRLEEAIQSLTESQPIDMIVMVAKNQNFIQRLLFRPLVEQISYHISTPFLVLHE